MRNSHSNPTLRRRDLLARLAGVALSFTGLTAFTRSAPTARTGGPKWDDRFELVVDFELAPQQGGRYHRPYVAVWVEEASGRPVRTLTLWVNTTGRGPRYIRELRRWFTLARDESDAGGPNLVDTVSSATRLPGRYSVSWNGRDDRGSVVELGTYRVFIEASREHGTYGLIQHELTLAGKPVASDLPGNDEIGSAHVDYRRRK
jgi:hypothetical protein